MPTASQIRQTFLEFFQQKGHTHVASAPLVNREDPTLLFTNAGMNQFKDFFLGNKTPQHRRITNTQRCLRVSGKHNDLEEVGLDTYHHTFFEMLGNWSVGDYFKKEAIAWAWELLTEKYGLDPDRMYATIFEGDSSEGLGKDEEALSHWSQILPAERILLGNKKDNFWEMGDQGPCGPSSEIHIDLRPEAERQAVDGATLVNQDHPQVVEIWNLVFIQYNRKADGSLESLPAKHVDTGMGFERLVMAIQGKQSNYDTDVFGGIIGQLEQLSGKSYGTDERTDVALRVVADHLRAVAFAVADGEIPSNNKGGYVIRRILRRAVRYGYTHLDLREPFIHTLVPSLATEFAEVFPSLQEQVDFVAKVVKEEEAAFLNTLAQGLGRVESLTQAAKASGAKQLVGADVFELYDTFGFPADLTALLAREEGLGIDQAGFDAAMAEQKNRSRNAAAQSTGDWVVVAQGEPVFVGYDQLETDSRLLRYRQVEQKGKPFYQLVLDRTPFYAESGGQVGDKGLLIQGDHKVPVFDTQKENDLIVHFAKELPADVEAPLTAQVNSPKRQLTANNHTATHLLQAALRRVLGDHVQQRGSLVNDQHLRFDFSHFEKVSDEQLRAIEAEVNQHIRQNIALVEHRSLPKAEALQMGATALFGEKYGDQVRVIVFDPEYSVELCGGTHVPATGQIGLFKITSESSVAAGIRRIEAITAAAAESHVAQQEDTLKELAATLKNPKDLPKAVADLVEANKKLEKALAEQQQAALGQVRAELAEAFQDKAGLHILAKVVPGADGDALKQLSYELREGVSNHVIILGAEAGGKALLSVMVDEALVAQGVNAGQVIREAAKLMKGGGGGQPFYATAGGKDPGGLNAALAKAEELVLAAL